MDSAAASVQRVGGALPLGTASIACSTVIDTGVASAAAFAGDYC